jgi:hypothetical protein
VIINDEERTKPTTNVAIELIKPRITPANALPITIEYKLTGAINNSSKLL